MKKYIFGFLLVMIAPNLLAKTFPTPWVALEGTWRHLPFETNFGQGHFQNNYYAPTLSAGFELWEFLSIEGGWSQSGYRHKNTLYFLPQEVLGFDLEHILENQLHLATSRYDQWYAALNAQYCLAAQTIAFLSAGVSFMRISFRTYPIGELTVFQNEPVEWGTSRRAIARLGVGLQQYLTPHIGLLASAYWENTSRLQSSTPADEALFAPVDPSFFYTAKAKDSALVSIGLFYRFCPKKIT